MNPAAVMISHVSRGGPGGIRQETLNHLARVDITPEVFESHVERGSDVEVKRLAWHAVYSGFDNPDGVLFFEDDLLIHDEGMRWFMNQPVPSPHDLVVLCLLRESLYPPSLLTETNASFRIVPLDLHLFRANRGFHGTMAIWISHKLVETLTERNDEFMEEDGSVIITPRNRSEKLRRKPCGFDFWLKDYVRNPAVVFPNPVDHVPNRSIISGGVTPHRSPSFRK